MNAQAKAEKDRAITEMLARISADRVAAGTCRHCGGAVPCWSDFGDVRVGVRKLDERQRRRTPKKRKGD